MRNRLRYNIIESHNTHTQADTTLFYDANGNMISDKDRGIALIKYNHLNLPDTIQFLNGNQIVHLYDAAGVKYKSIYFTLLPTASTPYDEIAHYTFNSDTVEYYITEYAGNIENYYSRYDILRRIFNTEGYFERDTLYCYYKDHLGNNVAVRNMMSDSIVQQTVYYASGLPMAYSFGRDKQPYLYNGKEFVEAHGYNTYDYGFRGYYATIGRFTTIDPLAEQTPWQSPYAYACNNFINNIDWMGLAKLKPHQNQWIATDDEGVVIDSDLTSPDKGMYRVNRETYERYTKNITDSNHRLLWLKTFGTQIGIHRDGLQGTILRGMKLDISWFNFNTKKHTSKDPTAEDEIYPMEMSQEDYLRMLYLQSLVHQGVIQPKDYMQYYNSFERGMITNSVIQSVAVGGVVVTAVEGVPLFYVLLQNSAPLQYGVGFMEGFVKAIIPGLDFTPYLYGTPAYQVGSDAGNIIVNLFKDLN